MSHTCKAAVNRFEAHGPYTFDEVYKLAKRFHSDPDFTPHTLLDKTAHKFPPEELRKILDPKAKCAEKFFTVTNDWNFVHVHAGMSAEQCNVVAEVGITDDFQQELDVISLSLKTRVAIVRDLREQARRVRRGANRDLSPKRKPQ